MRDGIWVYISDPVGEDKDRYISVAGLIHFCGQVRDTLGTQQVAKVLDAMEEHIDMCRALYLGRF